MDKPKLSSIELTNEVARIYEFIRREVGSEGRLVVGASGGIDSDVVARLCVGAVGRHRLKLFTVRQADMDERHLQNARCMAQELGIPLVELGLENLPRLLVQILSEADKEETFNPKGLLDVGKAKNSLRTFVFSMYAERSYIVVGCSNRTEVETGFYLPFGDGLAHILPIAHLYKTQVICLAEKLGTKQSVIEQPASAGYWLGETDLDDFAVWLVNEAPVMGELHWGETEWNAVKKIREELTFEALDKALLSLNAGANLATVASESGLSPPTVLRFTRLIANAQHIKGRPLARKLD